jgi:Kef-type K+ transport system membrane component KefB
MRSLPTEIILIILCLVVVVSYLFSILLRYIRVPSVSLLLMAGMFFYKQQPDALDGSDHL